MIDAENPDDGDVPVEVAPPDEPNEAPVSGEAAELARLRERLAAVEKEKNDNYERLLRTAADLDNFRKRSRREQDDARLKAREDLLKEMLPGIDNLERALAAAKSADPVVDGVRMVLKQFHTALERFDVKAFETIGQPFDPSRHEAIAQVESSEHPPGTVVTELQRGYLNGPRLLRPAMVTVAKARPPAPPPTPAAPEGGEEPPAT
jgi:molecular chaperone GrpE